MIKEDEIVVVFCDPATAQKLIATDPVIEDALVITTALEPGNAIVVPKKEFLDWIYERKQK